MNAIDRYSVARPRSAVIMSFLRSSRSMNEPAIGPKRNAGRVRASITPEIASDADPPPRPCTIAVTATNPIQSPNDETDIAASSRPNGPWVRRSRRVAGRVPRRAATSSVIVDTRPPYVSSPEGAAATDADPAGAALGVSFLLDAVARFFVEVVFFLAAGFFFAAAFLRVTGFFFAALAAARAARAADFAARASASASGSPSLVWTMSRSNSAPQPQHRIDFGRCTNSEPSTGQRGSFSGSLLTAKSQSGYRSHP